MREAAATLASTVPDSSEFFGVKGDPGIGYLERIMGSGAGWGGMQRRDALYAQVVPDKNDGETPNVLTVPANVSVNGFWSVIVYNIETYGFIAGGEKVGISSLGKDSLKANDDGSMDIWFAPMPHEGQESNWLPTDSRPFWITLRLYGPQPPLFDKSWTLGDIEKVDGG